MWFQLIGKFIFLSACKSCNHMIYVICIEGPYVKDGQRKLQCVRCTEYRDKQDISCQYNDMCKA